MKNDRDLKLKHQPSTIDESKLSDRELHFWRVLKMTARGRDMTEVKCPVTQYRFHPERKWRFDFAWPEEMVAVEIQGGTFKRGKSGHTSGMGVQRDSEKRNAATVLGWTVLSYTTKDLQSRPVQIVEEIFSLLKQR